MSTDIRIALSIPDAKKSHRHFSLRLKQGIFNEPVKYSKPVKILAVSDIEGNFMTLLKLLLRNKVIDKYLRWTYNDGHLVIVGDCFDQGKQVVECLWFIYSLEEKARKEGGYVHFLLGDHEIKSINGNWRYRHPKYAQSSNIPYTALYNGNDELWRWLCTKNIMEKIGDILFIHGGISKELLNLSIPITEINNRIRPYYTQTTEQFSDPLLNTVFNSDNHYQSELSSSEELVDAALNFFDVKTIVTGQTLMDHITILFNGKIINIATTHASGNSEALVIKKDRFYRVQRNGKRERIGKLPL